MSTLVQTASIELHNVSKSFTQGGATTHALRNTNFSAKPGEFAAIIGPSGSGKSTFLTVTGGLQTPDSGEVFIAGKNLNGKTDKERSMIRFNHIGFVLQASNLIPFLTVSDQLRLHDKIAGVPTDAANMEQLLDTLSITHLRDKYPSDLSGGERQRVAIARALYHKPDVVLADEPTASLDSDKAFAVVNLMADLTKQLNTTIIMVTHDQRMIANCDSVHVMEDGVLTQER